VRRGLGIFDKPSFVEPSTCSKDTEAVSETAFLVGELEGVSNIDLAGCDHGDPDSARAFAGPDSRSDLLPPSTCCGLGILDFPTLSTVDGRTNGSRGRHIKEAGVDAEVMD
jgi:hypothetical protein